MRRLTLLFLATALLAACSKGAPPTNAPTPAAANATSPAPVPTPDPKLARIFTPDVLGANIAYLETITGPAFKTDGHDRLYKVGDCQVIVGADKGKIANVGIVGYGPACSFAIKQYFAEGYQHPLPNLPTFGDLEDGLGGHYDADCLALCSNAADPVVSLIYRGSHADNFNDLVAQIPVTADATLAAWQDWSDKLAAKYGQAYVSTGKYHAGDSLPDIAAKDFAVLKPTTIRVGQNLPGT
jgi:hypothetical protein